MKIILRKTLVGGSKSITKEIEIEYTDEQVAAIDIDEKLLRVLKEGQWLTTHNTNPK